VTTTLDRKAFNASVHFMADLWNNNSKEWLDMNRDRYQAELRDPMKTLAEELRGPIGSLHGDFDGKPKISRINNDIRFARGRPLYKEHMWISFGAGKSELFAVVYREGWTACVTVGSPKREELDGWRRNLIDHHSLWKRWASVVGFPHKMVLSVGDSYKKALYDDTPEDVEDIVQAKLVYIYKPYLKRLPTDPVGWLADEMAALAPVYLMMTVPPAGLERAIGELVSIPPLGPKSAAVFQALGG